MTNLDPYQHLDLHDEPYKLSLTKLPSGALGRWAIQYEDFIRQIDAELKARGEVRVRPQPGVDIELVFP